MGKYTLRSRQKMKTMHKTVFMVAGASMLGLAAYLTIFMNTSQVTTTKAALIQNMMVGYDVSNGEVIASYNFDGGFALKAEAGPNAVTISEAAVCKPGGTENSKGIGPGKKQLPLNFEIPAIKELNVGGIDLSLDYRKSEDNCNLFTRGNLFNMGVKDGRIAIMYKVKKGKKALIVAETTRYEVPADDEFRNYRFVYDPVKGRSEIFVNGVAIWSHDDAPESALCWKENENLVVGKDLKGDGTDKIIIDNIMVKATRQLSALPVTLLNFEARAEKDYVMVTWFTAAESEIDSFIIQKSYDASNFIEVGKVKAKGGIDLLTAYAVIDKIPNQGLAYYRMVASNKPLKSLTVSMIGYKYRGSDGDLKVNDINASGELTK